MQKHTHFCRQLLVPPFVKRISQLFRKLYFRIHDPLLLYSSRCTPSVEPQSAKFSAHSYANDFANPANPVLTPWFIFIVQMMVREELGGGGWGGGGGGSKFNHVFLHRWTHPNLYFSTLFITLQQKVHSRRWRSPWVKTKYTAGPHSQ